MKEEEAAAATHADLLASKVGVEEGVETRGVGALDHVDLDSVTLQRKIERWLVGEPAQETHLKGEEVGNLLKRLGDPQLRLEAMTEAERLVDDGGPSNFVAFLSYHLETLDEIATLRKRRNEGGRKGDKKTDKDEDRNMDEEIEEKMKETRRLSDLSAIMAIQFVDSAFMQLSLEAQQMWFGRLLPFHNDSAVSEQLLLRMSITSDNVQMLSTLVTFVLALSAAQQKGEGKGHGREKAEGEGTGEKAREGEGEGGRGMGKYALLSILLPLLGRYEKSGDSEAAILCTAIVDEVGDALLRPTNAECTQAFAELVGQILLNGSYSLETPKAKTAEVERQTIASKFIRLVYDTSKSIDGTLPPSLSSNQSSLKAAKEGVKEHQENEIANLRNAQLLTMATALRFTRDPSKDAQRLLVCLIDFRPFLTASTLTATFDSLIDVMADLSTTPSLNPNTPASSASGASGTSSASGSLGDATKALLPAVDSTANRNSVRKVLESFLAILLTYFATQPSAASAPPTLPGSHAASSTASLRQILLDEEGIYAAITCAFERYLVELPKSPAELAAALLPQLLSADDFVEGRSRVVEGFLGSDAARVEGTAVGTEAVVGTAFVGAAAIACFASGEPGEGERLSADVNPVQAVRLPSTSAWQEVPALLLRVLASALDALAAPSSSDTSSSDTSSSCFDLAKAQRAEVMMSVVIRALAQVCSCIEFDDKARAEAPRVLLPLLKFVRAAASRPDSCQSLTTDKLRSHLADVYNLFTVALMADVLAPPTNLIALLQEDRERVCECVRDGDGIRGGEEDGEREEDRDGEEEEEEEDEEEEGNECYEAWKTLFSHALRVCPVDETLDLEGLVSTKISGGAETFAGSEKAKYKYYMELSENALLPSSLRQKLCRSAVEGVCSSLRPSKGGSPEQAAEKYDKLYYSARFMSKAVQHLNDDDVACVDLKALASSCVETCKALAESSAATSKGSEANASEPINEGENDLVKPAGLTRTRNRALGALLALSAISVLRQRRNLEASLPSDSGSSAAASRVLPTATKGRDFTWEEALKLAEHVSESASLLAHENSDVRQCVLCLIPSLFSFAHAAARASTTASRLTAASPAGVVANAWREHGLPAFYDRIAHDLCPAVVSRGLRELGFLIEEWGPTRAGFDAPTIELYVHTVNDLLTQRFYPPTSSTPSSSTPSSSTPSSSSNPSSSTPSTSFSWQDIDQSPFAALVEETKEEAMKKTIAVNAAALVSAAAAAGLNEAAASTSASEAGTKSGSAGEPLELAVGVEDSGEYDGAQGRKKADLFVSLSYFVNVLMGILETAEGSRRGCAKVVLPVLERSLVFHLEKEPVSAAAQSVRDSIVSALLGAVADVVVHAEAKDVSESLVLISTMLLESPASEVVQNAAVLLKAFASRDIQPVLICRPQIINSLLYLPDSVGIAAIENLISLTLYLDAHDPANTFTDTHSHTAAPADAAGAAAIAAVTAVDRLFEKEKETDKESDKGDIEKGEEGLVREKEPEGTESMKLPLELFKAFAKFMPFVEDKEEYVDALESLKKLAQMPYYRDAAQELLNQCQAGV